LSYVDTVSFGGTADYDSSADLNVFTEGIECGLVELKQVVIDQRRAHRPSGAPALAN